MTAKMYYDEDADPAALQGRTIAIIGYGSQGHAHALNLRDSGYDVVVGLAPGSKSRPLAADAGLRVADVADAVRDADTIMIAVPDTVQKSVYDTEIAPNLRPGQLLMFAHGFNIRFGRIAPPDTIDVGMVAPKGPGHLLRSVYESGGGVPALFAVHNDGSGTARDRVLAYARGLGSTRAGVLETTFAEETETDLFGEQALLCGGVSALVKAAFETLVEAGYQPELAYFETMHELKLIVDLMYRGGLNFMRFSVSDTAEFGDYVSGPRVTEGAKAAMKDVLTDIQSGAFATRWVNEYDSRRRDVQAPARAGPRPPDRAGRRGAPLEDAVPRPGHRPGRPGTGRADRRRAAPGGGRTMTLPATSPRYGAGVAAGTVRSSTPRSATASRRPAPASPRPRSWMSRGSSRGSRSMSSRRAFPRLRPATSRRSSGSPARPGAASRSRRSRAARTAIRSAPSRRSVSRSGRTSTCSSRPVISISSTSSACRARRRFVTRSAGSAGRARRWAATPRSSSRPKTRPGRTSSSCCRSTKRWSARARRR